MTNLLATMKTRATNAISNLEDKQTLGDYLPVYTDTERLLNYWHGYLDAITEIEHA